MSGPNPITMMCFFSGLLILCLSIPLLLEKIGPNGLYGFRTEKTKSDPKIWYAVNKVFGRNLLLASIVILATSGAMYMRGQQMEFLTVIGIETAATLVALGLAIAGAAMTLRKL